MPTTQLVPSTLGLQPSFGFGDRLGLATPGHLEALAKHGGPIRPIFAQQSIREMTRTRRTPPEVMAAAVNALSEAGYSGGWGADADHLKTPADVDATAAAGFVFFTIDPSEHVDPNADGYELDELERRFEAIKSHVGWLDLYRGRVVKVDGGPTIHFQESIVARAAVKYGKAIAHTIAMSSHIDGVMRRLGRDYEIELSVDETPQPTTLAEHYIIADQCRRANVKLVSLAPRYVGDFEKGIDYKGDTAAFEKSLSDHAAIARALGPYKLSLHSGSDKLSIYGIFGRVTRGLFHVKTAGTSYLEALRVVARHDPALFGRIVNFSRARFDTDKATYHISATLDRVPPPAPATPGSGGDRANESLSLDQNDGRQILHVTFGSVLTDPTLGPAMRQTLIAHPDTHQHVLAEHFGKHLSALRA